MDIFNKLFPTKKKLTQDQLRLQVLLRDLTLRQLENIAKEFISSDPKVEYKDSDGIIQTRKPNRDDYVYSIVNKVAYDSVANFIKR